MGSHQLELGALATALQQQQLVGGLGRRDVRQRTFEQAALDVMKRGTCSGLVVLGTLGQLENLGAEGEQLLEDGGASGEGRATGRAAATP